MEFLVFVFVARWPHCIGLVLLFAGNRNSHHGDGRHRHHVVNCLISGKFVFTEKEVK